MKHAKLLFSAVRCKILRCADVANAANADNILRKAIAKKIENGGECFMLLLLQ